MLSSISLLFISLLIPIFSIVIVLLIKDSNEGVNTSAKTVAVSSALVNLIYSVYLYFKIDKVAKIYQFVSNYSIYSNIKFNFGIGIDNISLAFILITNFLFLIAFFFTDAKKFNRNFYVILLLLQFAVIGTFAAINLLLFYIFFELSVFLVFFVMEKSTKESIQAQYKFLLFNVLGSFLMFICLIYIMYYSKTGNFASLFTINFTSHVQNILWWGLFLAFAVKAGVFPFHLWVSDTYKHSDNIVIMVLSGILIKFGIYGIIRIILPALPLPSIHYAGWVSILSLITALYTIIIAFTKDNIKSFIAYFSLSHIGIIIFGIFALTTQSIEGAILQSFNHSIFTIGLILMFVLLEKRILVSKFSELEGIINKMPLFSFFLMIIVLSGMSIPGTNTFIGEFLILQGAFVYSPTLAVIATLTVIFSATVMLTMYKKIIYGNNTPKALAAAGDLNLPEILFSALICFLIIYIGIFPQLVLDLIHPYTGKVIDIIKSSGIINNIF